MNEYDKGEIYINPKDISKLYANKKAYFNKLNEKGKSLIVRQDSDIDRGRIELYLDNKKVDIIY